MLHRGTKSPYFIEAQSSLPDDTTIIETDDFMRGRIAGYQSGTKPYVSFCDDDDYLNLSIPMLNDLARADIPAIYTNSTVLYQDTGRTRLLQSPHSWLWADQQSGRITVHQLTIVRRDVAEHAINSTLEFMGEHHVNPLLFDLVFNMFVGSKWGWHFVDVNAYTWRHWNVNQSHRGLGSQVDSVRRLFK